MQELYCLFCFQYLKLAYDFDQQSVSAAQQIEQEHHINHISHSVLSILHNGIICVTSFTSIKENATENLYTEFFWERKYKRYKTLSSLDS